MSRMYIGVPGHFIMNDRARYWLHTHVNDKYCVSTIGNIHERYSNPKNADNPRTAFGYDKNAGELYFETMIFNVDMEPHKDDDGVKCYCPHGHGDGLYCSRYRSEHEANIAHELLISKIENGELPWQS